MRIFLILAAGLVSSFIPQCEGDAQCRQLHFNIKVEIYLYAPPDRNKIDRTLTLNQLISIEFIGLKT
jgi:hypothetical protein